MDVKLTGDWGRGARLFSIGRGALKRAIQKGLKQEAQLFRTLIVKGIRDQAPGGKKFKPLSPTTLAIRRWRGRKGTKALIDTATMIRSFVTKRVGDDSIFIGLLRTSRSKDGKSLANIGAIQEYGALVVQGTKTGFRIIIIPARPFIQPTFDKYAEDGNKLRRRFIERVMKALGGAFPPFLRAV